MLTRSKYNKARIDQLLELATNVFSCHSPSCARHWLDTLQMWKGADLRKPVVVRKGKRLFALVQTLELEPFYHPKKHALESPVTTKFRNAEMLSNVLLSILLSPYSRT